jgi:hypothetical protein
MIYSGTRGGSLELANELEEQRTAALTHDVRSTDAQIRSAALYVVSHVKPAERLEMLKMLGLVAPLANVPEKPAQRPETVSVVDAYGKRKRARCATCNRLIHLRNDGTIGVHRRNWRDKTVGNCFGCYTEPKAETPSRAMPNHGYMHVRSAR